MSNAIYDSSLLTRVLRSRTLYAFYIANKRLVDLGLSVQKLQNTPVSELVVLEARLGQQIEYRNGVAFIPFEFDPDVDGGGEVIPVPPPIESTIGIEFVARNLPLIVPGLGSPVPHAGNDLYFYYDGMLATIDWGDGTIETINDTTPVSFGYVHHTYSIGTDTSFNVVVQGSDIMGLYFHSLPVSPTNPQDNRQKGIYAVDLSGVCLLETLNINYTNISDLTGLSCSPLLRTLKCAGLPITALDTSFFTLLDTLECGYNNLTALDISSNAALQSLDVSELTLTGGILDLTQNAALNILVADNNNLTQIITDGLTGLGSVSSDNALNLNVISTLACTSLVNASIDNSIGLNFVVFAGCLALDDSYDFSGWNELQIINISGCSSIPSIDVSGCTALTQIVASGCSTLSGLNLAGCVSIQSLLLGGCTSINSLVGIANLTTLEQLVIAGCSALSSIDLTGCVALTTLAANNSGLTTLTILNSPVTSLQIQNCISLLAISLSQTQLTGIDLSGCSSLTTLDVSNNILLTSLNNLSSNTLNNLNISYTNVQSIDLAGTPALQTFNASFNTSFDSLLNLAGKTLVQEINVEGCDVLTSFDIIGCTGIIRLNAAGSGITQPSLDAILAQLAMNSAAMPNVGIVDLRVDNDIEPSNPTGWNYVSTIRANGWTLEVNGALPPPPTPESMAFSYTVDVSDVPLTTYFYYQGQLESVDWGDETGTVIGDISSTVQNIQHTYSVPGTYNILVNRLNSTINPLTGLSFFTEAGTQPFITVFETDISSLQFLAMPFTGLTTLDIFELTQLQQLFVQGNPLTGIIGLTDKTSLITLNVSNCSGITSLDTQGCTALSTLNISGCSGLTQLITSACTSLVSLDFNGCNAIEVAELDNCPALTTISNITNKTVLTDLIVANDVSLNAVNVSGCTALTTLNGTNCSSLATITFSGNTSLATLTLQNSGITAITILSAFNLSSLNIIGCSNLASIQIGESELQTISFTGCSSLTIAVLGSNSKLSFLPLSGATALQTLQCFDCSLATIDFTSTPNITTINCANNIGLVNVEGLTGQLNLASLSLTNCSSLQSIDASGCGSLATLNITGSSSLLALNASSSSLSSLDVGGCNIISTINVSNSTLLTSIVNGGFTALPQSLTGMEIHGCSILSTLNLSGCILLQQILGADCISLTSCDTTGCDVLTFVDLSNCALTETNVDLILLQGTQVKAALSGTTGTIYLNGGINSPPSDPVGLDYYGYLIDSPDPWTVLINSSTPPPPMPETVLSYTYDTTTNLTTYLTITGELVEIDWGDAGPVEVLGYPVTDTTFTHTYAFNGTFTITLRKTPGFTPALTTLTFYDNVTSQPGIGNITPYSVSELFSLHCQYTSIDNLDITQYPALVDLNISYCSQLTSIIIDNPGSQITTFIANNSGLTGDFGVVALSTLQVLNVDNCTGLTRIDLDTLDNIVTFTASGCSGITGSPPLGGIAISNCPILNSITAISSNLTTSSINSILFDCKTNYDNSGLIGTVNLSGAGNAVPDEIGQGLKSSLILNGWTITTN